MPLYDFYCHTCDKTIELLTNASAQPECHECGKPIEKQVSRPAASGQSAGIIAGVRSQAAREGHFSNYKPSERPRSK
jgi:putative FmdB family regulatory protein